jgi:hypothetical protein
MASKEKKMKSNRAWILIGGLLGGLIGNLLGNADYGFFIGITIGVGVYKSK